MPQLGSFAYWLIVAVRDVPKLIRLVLVVAGVYFLLNEQWSAGFSCFVFLVWWKIANLHTRLEEIRDSLRGFTNEDVLEGIKEGHGVPPKPKCGLGEVIIILRDIRNNQMNVAPQAMR